MNEETKDGTEELTATPEGVESESTISENPDEETAVTVEAVIRAIGTEDDEKPEADATPNADEIVEVDETGRDFTSFDDAFLENISVESNVEKVVNRTKLPEDAVKYFMGIVYIVLGTVCAVLFRQIETVLPYVIGSILGLFSIVRFIFAIIDKEYVRTDSNRTASSLILLGLSIMIIVEHEWAHSFIPTVWGVWGLFEAAHAFNHAISRMVRHKKFFYYLVKGIVEVVIAFLLLYGELHIGSLSIGELHIIVFGISLVLDGIVALPFIHKFLTRK
ncbi:MAG: DUF308 domain-containing protein [Candidatus Coproplasma sp.]